MREIYFSTSILCSLRIETLVFIKRIGVEKVLSNDLVIES